MSMEIKHETETMVNDDGHIHNSKKRKFDEDSDGDQKRLTANSQERIRMQKINGALEDLKKCLPEQFHLHHRRMSKIRALRCAMMYIRNLSQLIHEDNMKRQEQYMQAIDYMRTMYDPRYMAVSPETGSLNEMNQTTFSPYYPYLGPLCADPLGSIYHTPVQNPPAQMYQPRPLDFSMTSQCEPQSQRLTHQNTEHDTDHVINGVADTPVKPKHHALSRHLRYSASATPLCSRIPSAKSETFTSPLVGLRNDNELNISFLSANSDHTREELEENQRPSSTLSDIVIGPC